MPAPTTRELTDAIKAEARALGFARVAVLPAGPSRTHDYYLDWLAAGFGGEMGYLARHAEPKRHPHGVMPGARSVVCLAANYHPGPALPAPDDGVPRGRVSRYARGRDYHDVLWERLRGLAAFAEQRAWRPVGARPAVDSAPVLEREWAARAGLGWVGRNAMLIDWRLGSYLFLAELLLDVELAYDRPPPPGRENRPAGYPPDPDPVPAPAELGLRDSCGSCTACIEACPTDAIVGEKTVDARRCISYLTIELKGPVPEPLRAGMGDWVFGCDVCQEVCPWNRRAPASPDADFAGGPEAARPSLLELLALDAAGFRERYRHTPVWRTRRRGLVRNAAIALGNTLACGGLPSLEREQAIAALAERLGDAEPVVRGAAAWALGRCGDAGAMAALRAALPAEGDPAVRAEIEAALRAASPTA